MDAGQMPPRDRLSLWCYGIGVKTSWCQVKESCLDGDITWDITCGLHGDGWGKVGEVSREM